MTSAVDERPPRRRGGSRKDAVQTDPLPRHTPTGEPRALSNLKGKHDDEFERRWRSSPTG